MTISPFRYTGLFILWICRCMCGCISNIWNRFRLPNLSDTRLVLSIRRAITRSQPQQEVSISNNESDEDRPPPLPPRNKKVETTRTAMFQKLTSKVSQGASSSTASEDESSDLSSSIFHRPHCSEQPAPSLESSRRRRKKLLKREHFKNMMSKVTNLHVIREEDLDKQEASGVKVPLSSLTRNSASDRETEQETSFTAEPHQSRGAKKDFDYINIDEIEEQAPTKGVYGVQEQAKASSTVDKQRDPDQTSASSLRSTKNQSPVVQDSVRQSPAQPSTSGYVPVFKLWNQTSSPNKLALIGAPLSKFGTRAKLLQSSPEQVLFRNMLLSTLKNQAQEQTLAVLYSDFQGEVRVSGIQCQSAASHIRLPDVESQSRPFDTGGTEGNQINLHPSPASANLLVSLPQIQEQISASEFSGSQVQSRLFNIQSSQGNRDQAAASYVKFQQLEELSALAGIRTESKQSSPEQSALTDVQTLLQSQVSSLPGIQRMPTYQGQTSSAGVYDLQRQRRISDVQRRRLSRKHTPIPNYRKDSGSERDSREEGLNLQQPIQSCVQFSLAEKQLRTSGISEVHESSSEERGLQGITLHEETSTPQGKSRTSNTLEKLRNLHQASALGFPEATSQTRNFGGGHELPLSTDYAEERFRGKAERVATQKRRGSLFRGLIRVFNIKTKRTEVSAESTSQSSACAKGGLEISSIQRQQIESSGGGYLPRSALSRSGGTTTQAHVATTPLDARQDEDRIRQRSSGDPSHIKETDNQETQIKETFVSLDLATGGVVLSKDGAEDETEADCSETSFMCDQTMDVLDLSHIEVPLSPKDIKPPKDKGESQNSEGPVRQSSTRTKRTEGSTESTSQLSTCFRGELETSNILRQQIGASGGGYLPHSMLSRSGGTTTQAHVATTPLDARQEDEDRIRQQSSGDPSHLKETDNQETQIKETFVSLDIATGGVILSKDGAEDETEADCSEALLMSDQPIDFLDLSHIEVSLPPKDIKPSKDKDEHQN